jgi:type I restriction-modification system DNA methylase subunit
MTTPGLAQAEIQALVKKFKSMSAFERKGMNEHATRQGYILPMFRALGWDVDNVNEVSPEEKVSRGWVDFSFRIAGIPRYFLETKRASEDLNDPLWVQQAIDYSWTKSVTWALLSNFEDLRVFNAEWKESDPFRAQFLEFGLDSYLTDFSRLWWFSREETLVGRLEREADKVGKRIKRLPVTLNLFDDLKQWRSDLYKSLRGYNPLYSPAQIDEAVLRLLNRLIFIRTAEDREVEPMCLMPLLRELEDRRQMDKLSIKLVELFRQFDSIYNSELFAPHFSEELYCDRPPLEALIRGLYEKNFVRYNFNALEADVLGTAYEQYLGHVVTEVQSETGLVAPASHVKEKHTKRKSQGIYYTPAFVTRHIVQQTVSNWLEEHGYSPSTPPHILDMACGSGSFLIEAFDTLDRFVAKQRNQVHGQSDDLHDNLRRLELLQSCIFGVDKDKQAVDVARLNLMLRALHGRQKLPLLENIYNADSLLPETWNQAFPEVLEKGGFDIIIGNPPYVRFENIPEDERENYANSGIFKCAYQKFDLFVLFIEKALSLLREGGRLGFIVPSTLLNQTYAMPLRTLILDTCCVERIVDFSGFKVFQDATVETCIIVIKKVSDESLRKRSGITVVQKSDYSTGIQINDQQTVEIPQVIFEKTPQKRFRIDIVGKTGPLVGKIDKESFRLGQIYYVSKGIVAYSEDGRKKDDFLHKNKINANCVQYLEGKDVQRYFIDFKDWYLDYQPQIMARPTFRALHESPKILVRAIAQGLLGSYDTNKYYADQKLICCVQFSFLGEQKKVRLPEDYLVEKRYDDRFVLGLINSRALGYYYRVVLFGGLSILPEDVRRLPIRRINFENPSEKSAHDEIVKLVEEILALEEQYRQANAALEDSRHPLKLRIETLDRELDQRVYKLYGLTEAEKKIVEGR